MKKFYKVWRWRSGADLLRRRAICGSWREVSMAR